jgi:glycosyltransferase involved in cell wall biosynthesis
MNLLVDARTAFDPKPRGIGKTLIQLYRNVARLQPDWQITMVHRNPDPEQNPFAGALNIHPKQIEIPGDRMGLWESLRLPLATLRRRPSLLHCPANTAPRLCPAPLLVTIHDLIPMEIPDLREQSKLFKTTVRRAAKRARHILTPSAYSAQQITNRYHIPTDKISVLPWAANDDMQFIDDPKCLQPCIDRYLLGERKVVLMFAAEDPRKTPRRVLRAWAALPETIHSQWCLLLVGLNSRARATADSFLNELQIDSASIRMLPYLPREEVPVLMSLAKILCFPSLSEGFGLPVLDAFRTHTAVITSDRSSLPEVAGDAAHLVNPTSIDSIVDALHLLMTQPQQREAYIQKGIQRDSCYRWQTTAEQFIQIVKHHFSA